MKRLIWAGQVIVLYSFTWFVALVPDRISDQLGVAVGVLMHRVLGNRRRVAEDNIRRCLDHMRAQPGWSCTIPDAEEITREVFRNIGRSLVETCQLYHGHGAALIDRVEVRGREHYEAARAKGKGMIFLTGHCGNWELGALAFSRLLNMPMSVVARRQNNPYLNRMVERMRMQYNNCIIYKDNALKNMLAVIRKDGVVGLLVDQAVFPEEGCLISFLGRPAWASRVPALLARKTGVVVLPAFAHREGDRHVIDIYPELEFSGEGGNDVWTADAQVYSRSIEQAIIAHPTDWYWVHRRWKRTEDV